MRFAHSLFVAICILGGSAAQAASFDCAKATRAVDKLICADADLSNADAALAAAYKAALAQAGSDQDRTTLRDSQRLWLRTRDAKCLRMVPAAASACLKDEYATRLGELKRPAKAANGAPAIFVMADSALNAAHPAVRGELEFPQGAFSPDGKLFAFAVNQIVSGDMDQVWIYSLSGKKLVPATVSPVRDKTEVTIQGFVWNGGTLYVTGTHGPQGDAQTPFVRAVTMTAAKDVGAMPSPPNIPGAARDTTAAAGDALADQGDKREEDAHYAVTSTNQGHGALTLTARDKSTKGDLTIATGSWNLGSFVFDAPRGRVVYVNGNGRIDIYSLATHKTVATITVPIDSLIDVSADGTLAAFSGNGRCDASVPAADGGRRQMLCFVKLPT